MKALKYWQLMDDCCNPLVEGNDNPANIPDNTPVDEATELAEAWMREHKVSEAILVENEAREDGFDEIVATYDLTIE